MALLERLGAPGPKRMLALDGGGIRGVLTLGFLERIESILRERYRRPDLVLADYFDLIGGTSTGSVIASALSIGLDAASIKKLYLQLGGRVFGTKKFLGILNARFDETALIEEMTSLFGDRTLGDESIRTGLCIVAKRADTRSVWPLTNHPKARYYKDNKDILLRQAIRASTAAPTYFVPEKIDVGRGQYAAFIDGGVSMYNNPAMQLFQMATLRGFPYHWKTGENELLLVSIGTGFARLRSTVDDVMRSWVKDWALNVPELLMDDITWNNQLLLQSFSRYNDTHQIIDREIGNLADDLLTGEPLLSYFRYNVWLEENALNELGLSSLAPKVESLRDMSAGQNRNDLAEIGERAAAVQVKPEHLPEAFDLPA
ncbi:MAG: patatin-like phospholipase family protein [Acidobacteriota bacterium]|nr:MAG: patatin-like phospholipase family protein [Acidobacteriota bacterium]